MYPKKSLGQNFLRCSWVTETMLQSADIEKSDTVLEIGPGTGALTRELAKHAGHVVAVEKDERLAAELADKIPNTEIIAGDILKTFRTVADTLPRDYKIIANIPYYLTSRLFRIILEQKKKPAVMVFTIQKEVAERISAAPPHMSILALSVQAYGAAKIIKTVPRSCFYPAPNVDSAIIKISDISDRFFINNQSNEADFFEIIKLGFSAKRKQLLGNLSGKFPKETVVSLFRELNINPRARAEELSLEQWRNLIKKHST